MDFSFSFMQGIMGNTIQQPPQLIDSANIRQEGAYDTGSDAGEDGAPSYDAALEAEFSYPPSASEDMPPVSNGYPPGLGLYEPQAKFSMYPQFPNGSANGYGAIRGYGEHCLMPGEGTVLRAPVLQERPPSPLSSPPPSHPHLHHPHHHHPHHYHPQPNAHPHSPPPLPSQHHLSPSPHRMSHVLPPPPPLLLPSTSPPPSLLDSTPSSHPPHTPPAPSIEVLKKTSSPEIKLKIIKTYQNGRELFESALCGDLLQESQASEDSQNHRRHERKKEKRKKTAREQEEGEGQDQEQLQGGTVGQARDIQPQLQTHTQAQTQPQELPVGQTEKPQKTPIKAEPKTPKACVQKQYPTVITGTGCCKDHEVGDLVWAKVGTYPWWPCMVSCDPQMNVHTRINTRGHREYHVQFFGSVAERAWIHEKRVVMYQGEHQFDELQAETLRKTTNTAERHKWEVGVGHAEDAFLMTQQERIDNYTFIYVDPDPNAPPPAKKTSTRTAGRTQRSSIATSKKEEVAVTSPDRAEPSRRQPCRQCSVPNADDPAVPQTSEKDQSCDPGQPSPPAREALSEAGGTQESPAPVRAWKTAAARKLLPLSITMKKLNVEITKCDQVWPLLQRKALPSPRREREREEGEGRQADLGYCSPEQGCGVKPEPSPEEEEKRDEGEEKEDREERRSDQEASQHTSCPGSQHSTPPGSQERKQQRRSVRSRSESEKGCEPVPKKKTKKEQGEMAPETTLRTGSQKGASEISDACKPLKKRSRASTDVEMASSQYRDTSDSDSRGLNDPQSLFGKSLDSPAAADADASDSQSVDSSLSRQGSSTAKRDTVCQGLVSCEGDCCRLFHLECLGLASIPEGKFTCLECRNGSHSCFSCKAGGGEVLRCSVVGCGRYYHDDCVRKLPGTVGGGTGGGFRCPQHTCATCCLERDLHQATKGRMMRCLRCPVAYHTGDSCVAAGSVVLTHHIMICSRHGIAKRNGLLSSPVNVNWCFLCARGEKLLCCALCPASFHPECLEMAMPEGAWSCRECRLGKKPHYKQIVWVKLGNYRWWPAEICNPRLVPPNIQTLRHDIGDFPVFFFGSHDYYWINQGRVFPYVENDKTPVTGQININKTFKKGGCSEVPGAQSNKPVGKVQTGVIKTEGCGWGLKTNQALRKGDFVTEYVGEVIDSEECQQRIKRAHENRVTDFYMLTLTKKWTVNGDVRIGLFTLCDIDAGTELTFNYNLDLVGNRRSSCHCGAENCSGFLGVRPTSAVVMEKEEKARNAKLKPKKRKLRPEGKRTHEYICFCCGEGGELVMCDKKDCPKAYHLLCLNLTKPPYGRWECPWHDCSVCGVPASSLCDFCPRSFCREHEGGALTPSTLEGRPCCSNHDPLSPLGPNANPPHTHRHPPGTASIKEEPSQEDRE
ncbi:unnamed protein product [Coregonus sp. 'balchen']|nr:unnamed protein product [Coregonus sp. 'balchen']